MAGGANAPRNLALAVGGNAGADDVIMDAWFALTRSGGGQIADANLTAANAKALWDNFWEAADIQHDGAGQPRIVHPDRVTGNVDKFATINGLANGRTLKQDAFRAIVCADGAFSATGITNDAT